MVFTNGDNRRGKWLADIDSIPRAAESNFKHVDVGSGAIESVQRQQCGTFKKS